MVVWTTTVVSNQRQGRLDRTELLTTKISRHLQSFETSLVVFATATEAVSLCYRLLRLHTVHYTSQHKYIGVTNILDKTDAEVLYSII